MSATDQQDNPLGLNLDFMFGRGYLWSERERLADWIALESLRMEIPDLQFPFDARGGLNRFRHTRCQVREVEFAISEVGLADLLEEAVSQLEGFEDLQLKFLDDAAHVSVRVSSLGADTHLSFRAALISPEPARADELHLSLYDYRAFGPLPYPARLVVHELVTNLLETPVFRAPGRGDSFTVGVAGDILRFRPLKLLFLHIFPTVGWKLPDLSGVVLDSARIRPGVLTIRAVDEEPHQSSNRSSDHELAASKEGARALAAYEAKELFSHADRAVFDGQIRQALSLLGDYRDAYGLHPALVARLLDCLLADASAANLAEAESIRRRLVDEDPDNLLAALAEPMIALARNRPDEALEAYESLAESLHQRGETHDWMLCELAVARFMAEDNPNAAAQRLDEIVSRNPRHRQALEQLRELYDRLGERAGLEETLKRLTGVYDDREQLEQVYMQLARHLLDRQGDLSEARMYLEKVLRLDSDHLEALRELGRSYVLGSEPLRALKAFGSAARTARSQSRLQLAGRLYTRVARLWHEEMQDARQASLAYRRAIEAFDEAESTDLPARVAAVCGAARMSEHCDRGGEALELWTEAVQLLEPVVQGETDPFDATDALDATEEFDPQQQLCRAQRRLGRLYDRRDRLSAAASHFRRVLQLNHGDEEAFQWLENHLRRGGRPEDLIELYREQIEESDETARRLELVEKLGDLYAEMGLAEDAHEQYRAILRDEPRREQVRRKLVELLEDAGRHDTLCEALREVVEAVRDRSLRAEISMELARACESAGKSYQAIRASVQAAESTPADHRALQECCRLLDSYVEQRGPRASAPGESSTAGELLQNMLIRLAEVAPSVDQQREVLLKVAMIADRRGDSAGAAEARQRAAQLERSKAGDDFDDVDRRLDAMLDDLGETDDPEEPDEKESTGPDDEPPPPQPQTVRREFRSPLADRSADDLPRPSPKTSDGDSEDETGDEGPDLPSPSEISPGDDGPHQPKKRAPESNLSSFRRRLASLTKRPSELPDPDEIERKSAVASTRRREEPRDDTDTPQRSESASSDEPETVRMPAEQFESLREESSEAYLDDGDDTEPHGQPGDDGWSMSFFDDADLQLDDRDFEFDGGEGLDDGDMEVSDEHDSSETTGKQEPPPQTDIQPAREKLEQARKTDDPSEIAGALENLLEQVERTDESVMSDDEIAGLSKELGELLYYDLEKEAAARPHLERVRQLEPEGRGGAPGVVNALESIYEETGDVDARVGLLEQRLEAADDVEMETTYRLLIAQTLWNQREDAEAARRWLNEVLMEDEQHEGAHRLLAEIAEHQQQFEQAADHLKTVVRHSVGGIEAVEMRRRLAELALEHLDEPRRAAEHFEQLLESAPGDARAIDGLKQARAMLGEWQGYIETLGRELGLLVGEPDGLGPDELVELDTSTIGEAVQVPAAEILSDAAHILEQQLDQPERARTLWGLAFELWPEHAEALERRIELDRETSAYEDLAEDLEAYAAVMLDSHDRFEALVEAADIQMERLDEPRQARRLYARAVELIDGADHLPEQFERVQGKLDQIQHG